MAGGRSAVRWRRCPAQTKRTLTVAAASVRSEQDAMFVLNFVGLELLAAV